MFRGLVTAFRTLSVLPIPGRESGKMSQSLPWFPLVGFTLGLIVFGAALGVKYVTNDAWPEGCAVFLLLTGVVLTRGLHLDGIADWADGFFGAADRDGALRIMKDPRTGAFGVIALVTILLAKWAALARIAACGSLQWIVVAYVVSRTAQVDLATAQPYARSEGGTGAAFVGTAGWRHLAIALALAVLLLASFCGFDSQWVASLLAGLLISRLFGIYCRHRVGGVTGDLLGANSEIVETIILAAGAVLT